MNGRQLRRKRKTQAHRLWQQKKIDRPTYGLLLNGDCKIMSDKTILRFCKGWNGDWDWRYHGYVG